MNFLERRDGFLSLFMSLRLPSTFSVFDSFRYQKQSSIAFAIDGNHCQNLLVVEILPRNGNQRLHGKSLLPDRIPSRLCIATLLNLAEIPYRNCASRPRKACVQKQELLMEATKWQPATRKSGQTASTGKNLRAQ